MGSFILLVDDNAIQATTRKAILERTGKSVLVASDGQAAIEILSGLERSHDVALIVTDHLMPRMNGPELVSGVRKRGFTIPIIVLSGHPEAEFEYQNLGVVFRLKPFAPDSLIQLTHDLLRHRMPRTA